MKTNPNIKTEITFEDFKAEVINDYTISLYDSNGSQVVVQSNIEQIATHTLPTGSYILLLTSDDSYFSEMIQIYR